MHCDDVIRGEIGHGLGQVDQGSDVADHIRIRLLGWKKPGGKGLGRRGAAWSSRGVGRGLQRRSTMSRGGLEAGKKGNC
jgi:hypothetical protein